MKSCDISINEDIVRYPRAPKPDGMSDDLYTAFFILNHNGKKIIEISLEQMNCFAGNMLELRNTEGEKLLVMSKTARQSLTPEQVDLIEQHLRIVAPDIHTIETVGGGSARCMIAELF